VLLPAVEPVLAPVRQRREPQPLSRPARAHTLALGPELPSHPHPRGGGAVTAPVRPSAVEQSRASHRLQLPRRTGPGAVLSTGRNPRPDAVEDVDGALEVGDGPRLEPDPSPRGAGRWTLQTPRVREDPRPEGMGDSHGSGRAFPEGMPFGIERAGLD